MRPDIEALLHRWLPGHDLRIERAGTGGSTEVYRISSDHTLTWLRLAEDPAEDRSVEYAVHERLRALGAHVPEILMFDIAPPELDRSAALTSHIPGIPLQEYADSDLARNVARLAGEDLARINSVAVTGYGWIDRLQPTPPEIVAEHPTRSRWTAEYTTAAEHLIAHDLFPVTISDHLLRSIDSWCQIGSNTAASRLAHGDFDPSHIYVNPETGAYTGIIDFGEARGTEPEYDLGHFLLHDGQTGRPSLYHDLADGWGVDPQTIDRAKLQAVAIGTRQLARLPERGQSPYRKWITDRLIDIVPTLSDR